MAEFCEKCFLETVEDFVHIVVPSLKAGYTFACAECGLYFDEGDLAYVHETGECPACHTPAHNLWMKAPNT